MSVNYFINSTKVTLAQFMATTKNVKGQILNTMVGSVNIIRFLGRVTIAPVQQSKLSLAQRITKLRRLHRL